ncbi:TonB-dependent receptor plug domain-containing protein [Primorskyibacter sp. S187A]|uniref:TonB-dependent receptor plug domain-containing protein n=1 Tax=Primorskyibacter sp. S187A TaxID=3415130 RepID=UPI003C7EC2A8
MPRHHLRRTTALALLATVPTTLAAQETVLLDTLFQTLGKRDLQLGTPVTSTVVDATEISDRQAGTIGELIDSVPGVTLINGSTPQGSGINIRGWGANGTFGNDQKIAVVVDGARVGSEELYRLGSQLFTDPFLYREVEVFRGTIGSFEYGSGIVGGVVRLETKDASDFTDGEIGFRLGQTLQFSSNGNGAVSSTTLTWQPTERAEFLANYTIRKQDDMQNGEGDEIGNSSVDQPSWLAKARFTFGDDDAHSLTFSTTSSVNDESDVPQNEFASVSDLFGRVDRRRETQQASLRYGFNPGNDLINLTADLTYARESIDQTYLEGSSAFQDNPFFGPQIRALADADHNYTTTTFALKNRALFETGVWSHNLLVGAELQCRVREENELNSRASAPGGIDNRFALVLIDEMTNGGWTVTPALRFETSDVTSDDAGDFYNEALMGGLGLAYEWDNGFSVFASYAYTEGLAPIDDIDTPDRMEQSEKSETYEIGAGFGNEAVFMPGDNLSVRLNLYHMTTWDITSYTQPGSVTNLLDNVEQRGAELEASYGLENGLYFDLNANFVDGEENYAGGGSGDWRNIPADTTRLTIGKRWDEMLDLSWEVVAVGEAPRFSTGEESDPYTLNNLRATYVPQSGVFEDFEVRLGIENAFDIDYRSNLATKDGPGRNVKLSISKVF